MDIEEQVILACPLYPEEVVDFPGLMELARMK